MKPAPWLSNGGKQELKKEKGEKTYSSNLYSAAKTTMVEDIS